MGGTDLADHADCSGFVHCIYREFGIPIPRGTSNLATDAKEFAKSETAANTAEQDRKYIKGPCMGEGTNSTAFSGTKEEAKNAIEDFCDKLQPGDLILFDLSDRNGWVFGDVNHVVMYAGNGMIVEEPNRYKYAKYHSIKDIIFKEDEDWTKRLPVYALSYLTADQRTRFTIPED